MKGVGNNVAIGGELKALSGAIDEALELLREFSSTHGSVATPEHAPGTLLDQCVALCTELASVPAEPVRTVHHLACSGGTVISKCIAAMPNTQVMSEVDPLSTLQHKPGVPRFAPTDMIQQARQSTRGASAELLTSLFLGNLDLIRAESARTGQRLVLRDHAHSHYCTGSIPDRPTLRSIVASRFPTRSVVTVRDPVDSFLSLKASRWLHFEPQTFEEYCRRYLLFLDAHGGVPFVRYEDFLHDPQRVMGQICEQLELAFSDQFVDLFDTFRLTGDSGRKSDTLELRPRRTLDDDLAAEMLVSTNYRHLQVRLGYPWKPSY